MIEIVLDLPFPPSVNDLWTIRRGVGKKLRRSDAYEQWIHMADATTMELRQYPKHKIHGPFSIHVALAEGPKCDADNVSFKAPLDWLQSRDVIRNDRDCRKGSFEWVSPEYAPRGLRLTLKAM